MGNNPVIKCKITKSTIKCSIKENKIVVMAKGFAIGDAHNHNNLYYQKEEVNNLFQTKLDYVPEYRAYEVD